MTQEEKAKRYDEAIKRAKGVIEQNPLMEYLKKGIEYILPELRESEDEKVRKELICFLKSEVVQCEARDKYIAWLEKQGEQKQDPCVHCDDKRLNCHNFPCIKKRAFKQGKSALEAIIDEKVDNQNCVKTVDKVEPKFKAGDWIVRELDNSVHQGKAVIENISNGKYGYDLTKGGYISSQDANFYHLWTIQDAKAGDVIYSRHNTESFEWIGIFKSLDKENKGVHFYGFWNNVTKTFKVCGNELFVSYDDFSPATKEQRKQLEKAMADAGYTFDFEKKELKRIEKKSFWSKEDEAITLQIEQIIKCASFLNIVPEKLNKINKWLKSLKQRIEK